MNLLLKYGGPRVNLILGFLCICGAIGALFTNDHFTVSWWLRFALLVLGGALLLFTARGSIRRK